MSDNYLLTAALSHAAQGRYVFPVARDDKRPITSRGFLDATIDPVQITQWWTDHPDSNIGLSCRKSGLLVIDVDPDNGGDETFAVLESALGALPRAVHQRTGSGGSHVFMRDPSPGDLGWTRNHDEGGLCKGKLGPGVDVKNNGYVLVEPSVSSKGPYLFTACDWANVPAVPEAWQGRLKKPAAGLPGAGIEAWEASAGELSQADENALCELLDGFKRGQGQSATFQAIRTIFHDYGRSLSEGLIYLEGWNEQCGNPHSNQELDRQVERVADNELVHPRGHLLAARQAAAVAKLARLKEASARSQTLPYTDLWNAERFVSEHKDRIRYVHAWKQWLIWDGTRWKPDDSEEIHRLVHETVKKLGVDAAQLSLDDDGKRRRAMQWALLSGSVAKINAIEVIARKLGPVVISPDKLDSDPCLFNVQNGTVDMNTGKLRPHSADDLITKIVPIDFDPQAQCPLWESFMLKIFPSQALRDFVRRAVGYSLTGRTSEQCMFILFGKGCNGKSTFVETLRAILGNYGCATEMATFIAKKGDDGISNEIAALQGKRFVTAAESEHGRALAESLIKSLTGGDKIKARKLYQEGTEFIPVFKIWLCTNHKPGIKGTDDGIWRRLRLIPFKHKFGDHEKDTQFGEKLKGELAGILRWAVEGLVMWNAMGLGSCAEVDNENKSYRAEMDPIGPFLEDRCVIDPAQIVPAQALMNAYKQWCADNACPSIGERDFGERLKDLGLKKGNKSFNSKVRVVYTGIGVQTFESLGLLSQALFAQQSADPEKANIDQEFAISEKN